MQKNAHTSYPKEIWCQHFNHAIIKFYQNNKINNGDGIRIKEEIMIAKKGTSTRYAWSTV